MAGPRRARRASPTRGDAGHDRRSGLGRIDTADRLPDWLDRAAYPFRSRWAALSFGRMHYIDEGRGDTIVFVHGTPTWSFEWRHLIVALSSSFRCIAPDHLGFGLSERPREANYTPEAHAERFAEFLSALALDRFTLVVHDFGGPIALPVALDGQHAVDRIIVINSWMWPLDDDPDVRRASRLLGGRLGRALYGWLNLSLRVIMPAAYSDRRALTRAIHAQYLAPFHDRWARQRVLWPLARSLLGSQAHYDRLWSGRDGLSNLPALIVWGTEDPAFKPHHLARWRAALPRAGVRELPVGHWPHEEDASAVIHAVSTFLASGASA